MRTAWHGHSNHLLFFVHMEAIVAGGDPRAGCVRSCNVFLPQQILCSVVG